METKKITPEELQSIKTLKQQFDILFEQVNGIATELWMAKMRVAELEKIDNELKAAYLSIKDKQKAVSDQLGAKYGDNIVSIDYGTGDITFEHK